MTWNNLTDRQKQLDKAIQVSGIALNSSDSCLRNVMNQIGASPSEKEFIKQRILLRLRAASLLDETDVFIDKTERMLEDLEKDDQEWKRRGKALGFDF